MNLTLDDRKRGLILLGLLVAFVAAVVYLGHVLLPFFIAFSLVYLLNPTVTSLSRSQIGGRVIGRLGAIGIVYLGFFLLLWFVALFVLPQLYIEVLRLAQILPKEIIHFERNVLPEWVISGQEYLDSYDVPFDIKKSLADGMTNVFDGIQGQAGEVAKRAKDLVAGIFHAILLVVLVFMLTGFLLYDLPRFQAWLTRLVPERYRPITQNLMRDIDRGLAGAVRGQIVVCIVNAILTTAGLLVLGVKFAITLGVVAGVCSLIPVFGTLISTIPAVLVGLTHSPVTAVLVLAWILLIHLLEANVLNPKIIGHNAELHPALVVLALLIGEHYGGVTGLLIAVPLATVVRALVTYTFGRLLMPPDEGAGGPPMATALPAGSQATDQSDDPIMPMTRPEAT